MFVCSFGYLRASLCRAHAFVRLPVSSNAPHPRLVENFATFTSAYRKPVDFPSALFARVSSTAFQAFASLWEGIISFRTLLSFFLSSRPGDPLSAPCRLFCLLHRFSPYMSVRFKHFLFVSFSLYLYYTTNFIFVKRFFKIFLIFLKKFFWDFLHKQARLLPKPLKGFDLRYRYANGSTADKTNE